MKQILASLATGTVFGIGLIVSGMTDPAKVMGFLDLAGAFDPTLAFVMGAAVPVAWIGVRLASRRQVAMPASRTIDRRLVLGSVTFGIGWGLAGYCPGPALASLLTGGLAPLIFAGAMIAGMLIFELAERP